MNDGCHVCELNAAVPSLPPPERLYVSDDWRVAHAWSALPGWLIVTPRRHVESLAELTPGEATEMGDLLRAASVALVSVVGCRRTYAVLFAEKPRYNHLHIHLVPRMDWFSEEDRGPAVFRHINVSPDEQVPVEEQERLATALASRISAELA